VSGVAEVGEGVVDGVGGPAEVICSGEVFDLERNRASHFESFRTLRSSLSEYMLEGAGERGAFEACFMVLIVEMRFGCIGECKV
jgi:hypothetical protein